MKIETNKMLGIKLLNVSQELETGIYWLIVLDI